MGKENGGGGGRKTVWFSIAFSSQIFKGSNRNESHAAPAGQNEANTLPGQ